MNENIEVEFERAKMRNYILEKENEILLGKIGAVCKEKEELLKKIEEINAENNRLSEQMQNIKKSKIYKIYSKTKNVTKRK